MTHRIQVMGPSGSGKTTVALRLAAALGVPHVELDALHWLPGWAERDAQEFRDRVHAATEGDGWVASGNYTRRALDILRERADMIVWLDLPLHTTIPRILARSWRRWRARELLWGTNVERFWPQLAFWDSRQSLVAFTLKERPRQRGLLAAAMLDPRWAHLRFVRLTSQREIDRFVSAMTAMRPEGAA